MPIDPEELIMSVLAEQTGLRKEKLHPEARLFHDLGIGGDDAQEVLLEISDKCSMDVSDFDFLKYFRSEPTLLSLFPFLPSQKKERAPKLPLTVGDLIEAARRGKLT